MIRYSNFSVHLRNFVILLSGSAGVLVHAMDFKSNPSLNTSPVQLRVKAISKLQPRDINKSLIAAVSSLKPLLEKNISDDEYLLICYSILKTMGSFEYLDNQNLLTIANELNALLYVLKKDENVRFYCMGPEHESFRKSLKDVLINTANTALALFRNTQRRLTTNQEADFSTRIKAIEQHVLNLSGNCRNILQIYSDQLTGNVRKYYAPLDEFLQKSRECQKIEKSIGEIPAKNTEKPSAPLNFAAIVSKNAQAQNEQQTKLRALKEAAKVAHQRFNNSKLPLRKALGELQTKSHLLRNSAVCKSMALCKLSDPIVINSFFYLINEQNHEKLKFLMNRALKDIAQHHQSKLRMVLQLYVGESCVDETAQSAKGRIWEIAVALFLHDNKILKDMGRDIPEASKKFAREFDVSFEDPEILADCKALDWEYWYPKADLTNPSKNKKVQQILDQAKIAASRQQDYVIISKYDIPPDHQTWLSKEGVLFISKNSRALQISKPNKQPIMLNFENLYNELYCFEF